MIYRAVSLKSSAWFLAAGIFSLTLAGSTLAQKPAGVGPPPNNNPNLQDRARQVDESRLRSAEMGVGADEENQKRLQAAILSMKEDFTRIQVLRNDIARNLVARKPLDYQLVSDQAAEINKRASRLNVYMRQSEDNEKVNSPELKSEEMVGVLVRLCKLIDSFTENPALKNVTTVDLNEIGKIKGEKAKADRDLLAIIKLSGNIQKKSDALRTSQ